LKKRYTVFLLNPMVDKMFRPSMHLLPRGAHPSDESPTSQLLRSISEVGLKASGRTGAIRSTHGSGDFFFYNQVNFTALPKLMFDETVNALCFNAKEGLWSIAGERSDTSTCHGLSDAVLNSVVFVFDSDVRHSSATSHLCEPGNFHLCGETPVDEGYTYFHEVRTRGEKAGVIPPQIKAILAPLHVFELVKTSFPNALVVPVTPEIKKISNAMFLSDIRMEDHPILGLNYTRALHIALAERPDLGSIGIHLTRLPLSFRTERKFSLNDNKALYTFQDGQEKICFRLTQLSPEKIEDIKAIESVLLMKEHRLGRHYLCYCSASDKDEIHDIVTRSAASASIPTP
jgi:hypothetical protein